MVKLSVSRFPALPPIRAACLGLWACAAAGCSSSAAPDGGLPADGGAADAGPAGDAGPTADAGPALDGGPTVIDAGRYTLTVLAPGTPDPTCDPHGGATDAQMQFTDVTAQWGLGADGGLPMEGTSFVAADLDGDGYPDLIVTNGFSGFAGRETIPTFWDGGLHNLPNGGLSFAVALLMNRPSPDGKGRVFVDETQSSGLAQIRGGSGGQFRQITVATVGDVDGDGTPDVFTAIVDPPLDGGDPDTDEMMLNDGTGHFSFAPQSAPSTLAQNDWYTQGMTFTDVDDDGRLDLYEAFWYDANHTLLGSQQQLFHGNGDGTFGSITQDAGLELVDYDGPSGDISYEALYAFWDGGNSRPAQGVAACDLDGDGYPELIESSYGQEWNTLYQNNGAGTSFQEVGRDCGYAGDDDHDYHDNQYFVCFCQDPSNASNPDCADAGRLEIQCPTPLLDDWSPLIESTPADTNGNGFTTVCRDMFGSGKNDLYVANIKHWWDGQSIDPSNLLVNVSDGGHLAFLRMDAGADGLLDPDLDPQQGWNQGDQGAAAADFNNDGRPDLLVGESDYPYQRALLFIQQPDGGTFREEAMPWGVYFPCAIGMAVADFDRDGDLDLILGGSLARNCASGWPAIPGQDPGFSGYSTAQVRIFSSNASQHSKWLEIRLRGDGVTTNTMGIGARVTVTVNGVSQMQEMQSTFGHAAFGDDIGMLFFGLGGCGDVDSVQVRWPNKALAVDTYANVPANHFVELHQGDPTIYGIDLP